MLGSASWRRCHLNCVLRNKRRRHMHNDTDLPSHTHTQGTHKHTQGTHIHRERTHIEVPLGAHPGRMAWQKFSPTPTPNSHTLVTRTSMSPIIPLLQMFFSPENLTGPLSRALLTQEGQVWRAPGECRQDIWQKEQLGFCSLL